MAKHRTHRTHSIAFKRQVVQEYLAGETLHGLARHHDLSRTLIRIWVDKCEAAAFDEAAAAADTQPGTALDTGDPGAPGGMGAGRSLADCRADGEVFPCGLSSCTNVLAPWMNVVLPASLSILAITARSEGVAASTIQARTRSTAESRVGKAGQR